MTHFHVTLPSDGSSDTYPGNTTSRFTTKLPERIELDGEYEVGLSEFIYPHTWFNFDNSRGQYWIGVKNNRNEMLKFSLKRGYYVDGIAFAIDLNRQVTRALLELHHISAMVRFTFNPSSLKMSITGNAGRGWFVVSHELMKFLGFPDGWPANPKPHMTAKNLLDLNRGKNLMYIYCDAADYSIVGDVETPLLRVCNPSGKDGEYIRTIYTHPQYVPLARNSFETIEINITDELGRHIPFVHGKAMVTLHFRSKNSLTL